MPAGQRFPGVRLLLQQRPTLQVARVIDDALKLHRPALQLRFYAPAGQHHTGCRLLP
ncbi:hypothetical protein D3C81_978220 [compost metagenome]